MIRNYLKTTIRSLLKRKTYFGINVIGLASSIAVSLILFVFILHEWSYDSFHEKRGSIYKIHQIDYLADDYRVEPSFWNNALKNVRKREVTIGIGDHLKDLLPDIKRYTRFGSRQIYMRLNETWVSDIWHFADSTFLDVFSFPLIDANVQHPLSKPTDLVISIQAAEQYFGTKDVLGKQLSLASGIDRTGQYTNTFTDASVFEIAAVVDVPSNSSVQFDFLISTSALKGLKESSQDARLKFYSGSRYATFFELNKAVDVDLLRRKVDENLKVAYQEAIDILRTRRNLSEDNPVMSFELKNMNDVRFDISVQNTLLETRSPLYVLILLIIGLLITFIVSINCITLNLGTLGLRGNELGVRKILGAKKKQLALQFYLEGALQLGVASVLAFTLAQLLIPVFNRYTGADLNIVRHADDFLIIWSLIFLTLSLVIGLYPLLVIARFKISEQLNGWSTYKIKPKIMKGIIAFQLAIGIFLFVLVINMKDQFEYLLTSNMGFDKEHVVVLEELRGGASTFKSELVKSPLIKNVSLTNSSLFTKGMFAIWWNPPNAPSSTVDVFLSTVDEDFLNTMNIQLDSGRYFQNSQAEAQSSILINQSLKALLKSSGDTTGKFDGKRIIGVVSDFNIQNLTHEISPVAFGFKPSTSDGFGNAYIKVAGGNVEESLDHIKQVWTEVYPERAFDFKFLDDKIEREYQTFGSMIEVVSFLSYLALFFAFMGLFGLMSILIINKFKEVGIRKVFGAKAIEIYMLLSKDFALMVVVISVLIAYPCYLIVEEWLKNFAYSSNQFITLFVIGVLIITTICMVVVSFHTINVSRKSPVKFIRYE